MKLMEKTTDRGFKLYEFTDKGGRQCSIQESSFGGVVDAIDEDDNDPRIIIGINNPTIKALIPNHGWVDIEPPGLRHDYTGEEYTTFVNGRMELSQTQVKELLPILEKFVKDGCL